jgi:hypothetical protein
VLFQRLFERAGIEAVICDPQANWRFVTARCGMAVRASTWSTTGSPISRWKRRPTPPCARHGSADAALITPHPQAHALYADKRNLVALVR